MLLKNTFNVSMPGGIEKPGIGSTWVRKAP